MLRNRRLFRFNVHGLGSIGLDESKQKPTIVARTESYLDGPEVLDRVQLCVAALADSLPRIDGPGEGLTRGLSPQPATRAPNLVPSPSQIGTPINVVSETEIPEEQGMRHEANIFSA